MKSPLLFTRLWVGLGNPGEKYKNTRHNIGIYTIESLLSGFNLKVNKKFYSLVYHQIDFKNTCIIFPQTYMNSSGKAVLASSEFFRLKPEDILVFHDEIELPPGKVKYKYNGGDKGHNGLRDITAKLGTSHYHRIQLGVGKPVLEEQSIVDFLIKPADISSIIHTTAVFQILEKNGFI